MLLDVSSFVFHSMTPYTTLTTKFICTTCRKIAMALYLAYYITENMAPNMIPYWYNHKKIAMASYMIPYPLKHDI
jgi:hypothetical protein